nr:hypothetical protein [Micromonospora sp. DSM 115978]
DAYTLSLEEVGVRVQQAWDVGATEVCVQGGIHPDLPGTAYFDLAKEIKRRAPEIHLHAYSPMEVVNGVSRTASGLHLLPLMGGLLVTSIVSGRLISRWGRYKVFPVVGTAMIALGLYLLSFLGPDTSLLQASLSMFVFGAGLGCVVQVLLIAVQNSVNHSELGVATSGTTFFRSIGGSFGAAVFGAIFANVLSGKLSDQLAGVQLPPGFALSETSPHLVASLPPAVHAGFVQAYSDSLQVVFLVAVPIGLVAFALSWLLPEIRMRRTVSGGPATAPAPVPAPAAGQTTTSIQDRVAGEVVAVPGDMASGSDLERSFAEVSRTLASSGRNRK